MRYTLTIVEQLDRAAVGELRVDHPINNRMALILIDNAMELILHRRCSDHADMDQLYPVLGKLGPKKRAMARGKELKSKLKVLENIGDISHQERKFIGAAHECRNVLYHVGLELDDITRAISGYYYRFCCDLFVRLKPSYTTHSSRDVFTEVAERYLPKSNGRIGAFVESEILAEKLVAQLPDGIEALPGVLAASARKKIHEVRESFEFLVHDNPRGYGTDTMLKDIQWHRDFRQVLEREELELLRDPGEY